MKLRVYTASYPFGFSESFLGNELEVLTQVIPEIEVYPYAPNGKKQETFVESILVKDEVVKNRSKLKISQMLLLLRILLIEFMHTPRKAFFLKKLKRHVAIVKNAFQIADCLEKEGLEKEVLHYSFWMNEWALALAVLKKRKKINSFVFRVNGYDIWDERHEGDYLPFRYFVYSQTSKIFALSKTSVDYLKAYNFFPEKIKLAYMGTEDLGLKKEKTRDKFTVFTCSSAIPLKRLDKIAEVLAAVNKPVLWIHHGEGKTITDVELILKKRGANVEFVLSKKKSNYREVLEFMKASSPDLFINLSETEGLPVTLIEAMSFGIPLLANRVGSCHEFFEEEVGFLVDKEAPVTEIAALVKELVVDKKKLPSASMVRESWERRFSAETNYKTYADELYEVKL